VSKPFRRQVQELSPSKSNVVKHTVAIVADPGLRANAFATQGFALVFHQCDEGRHNKAKPASRQRGQLKTQAFAATRRQQGNRVSPRVQVENRTPLMGAEPVESPVFLEEGAELFRDGE
jgi:hypothetical protein